MNQKIGTVQASFLMMNAILPSAVVVLPAFISLRLEQDAPFSIAISACFGVVVVLLTADLIRRSEGLPFIEWIGKLSSPLVARIIGFLLMGNFIEETSIILREFINFINENVLIRTPYSMLLVVALIVIVYMAWKGIEVITRVNNLLVMLYVIFVPIYLFGMRGFVHFNRLLPLFEHSFNDFLLGSIGPVGWTSELTLLIYLAPYLKSPEKSRFIGSMSLLYVSVVTLAIIVSSLVAFGPQYIKTLSYPGYSAVRIIQFGQFLENLDLLFVSFWIFAGYLKLSIFVFVTLDCFKQTFSVKETAPFLLALTFIIAAESTFIWNSPGELNAESLNNQFPGMILFNIVFPVIVYLMSLLKQWTLRRKETVP